MTGSLQPSAAERGLDLRLAHLHLRCGTYALARAELEALAGADRLDRDAVLDLAEVRWRTGDLPGAAAAASAWLEDEEATGGEVGRSSVMAHVICAEAATELGHGDKAAAHVEAASAGLGDRATLEAILAGIVLRADWPWIADAGSEPSSMVGAGVAGAASVAARTPGPAMEASPGPGPAASFAPGVAPTGAPAAIVPPAPARAAAEWRVPIAPAAAELARAGAGLVAAAPERAVVLLALALRADRAVAESVLATLDGVDAAGGPTDATAATGGATHAAALAFVRAEALRAAGRHDEARIAYASAERLALAPAEAGPPRSDQ